MRRLAAVVLTLAACSRNLDVPEPPGPGSIAGRIVYSVPGQQQRQPAAGALVTVLGTSLISTTSTNGNFRLEGIRDKGGSLLVRFDAEKNGTFERQRLLDLDEFGAGPGRQVALGDVVVAENARIHGRALLENHLSESGGHGGTTVFVPAGPFTTYTNDDGSFAFNELPAGALRFTVFRPGYVPHELDAITLRPGEDFALADIVISPAVGPQALGAVLGRVVLEDGSGAGSVSISGVSARGNHFTGSSGSDGKYEIDQIESDVYDVSFSLGSYSTVVVYNVFVAPGTGALLPDVALGHGATFDAGVRPPVPDAGSGGGSGSDGGTDAGTSDAGTDAGTSDAGTDGGTGDAGSNPGDGGCLGGCTTCTWTGDCPTQQWCDVGICRPNCTASSQCTGNRVCDGTTQTCVTPCNGSCGGGLICNVALNSCAQPCSMSVPCVRGQRCDPSGFCIAECANNGDCLSLGYQFSQCRSGACVPNGFCSEDKFCDAGTWCVGGQCAARTTGTGDGGFSCTDPCQCRQGERCEAGLCLAEPAPTVFWRADAGDLSGLLASFADGGTSPIVVALLKTDPYPLDRQVLTLSRANATLAGGYTACETYRWVRQASDRTTLQGAYFKVPGTLSKPVPGVALRSLDFTSASGDCMQPAVIELSYAPGAEVTNVAANAPKSGCTGPGVGELHAFSCDALSVTDFLVDRPGQNTNQPHRGIWLEQGSATVTRPVIIAPLDLNFRGISVDAQLGTVVIDSPRVEDLQSGNAGNAIVAANCQGPLVVRNGSFTWPRASTSGGAAETRTIQIANCPDITITGNVIDGRTVNGRIANQSFGMVIQNSGGVVSNNTLYFPTSTGNEYLSGIDFDGPLAALTVENNRTLGGYGYDIIALEISGVSSGPMLVRRNDFRGATAGNDGLGLVLSNIGLLAGVTVSDNVFVGAGGCSGTKSFGLKTSGTGAVLERNRFSTSPTPTMYAAQIDSSTLELYGNFFANAIGCQGSGDAQALRLGVSSFATVYAVGNTFEALGNTGYQTIAVACGQSNGAYIGNIFGAGVGNHVMGSTSTTGNCLEQSSWSGNYFWYDVPGAPQSMSEKIWQAIAADAGTYDAFGNIVANSAGCFDPLAPKPQFAILPTSACVDRGTDAGFRKSGTAILSDIDGGSRLKGAAVDVGCFEAN